MKSITLLMMVIFSIGVSTSFLMAQTIRRPLKFEPGEKASSKKFNDNFDTIYNGVNFNQKKIRTLENRVNSNQKKIRTLENQVKTLMVHLDQLTKKLEEETKGGAQDGALLKALQGVLIPQGFVLIKAGLFQMGSEDGYYDDEKPKKAQKFK